MEGWIGFVVAGFALAGSPGPATLSLAATGAAFGARQGLAYLVGITVGMVGVMTVTATGITSLLWAIPGAAPLVTAGAAGYFLYLAWRIATAPPLSDDPGGRQRPPFSAGVLLSLINPKGYAAMAALFSGFALLPSHPVADAALKIAALTAVIVAVNIVWLGSGAALTRHFRSPRSNRLINVAFALLLILSVGAAALL